MEIDVGPMHSSLTIDDDLSDRDSEACGMFI